jgi:hypothetical protein
MVLPYFKLLFRKTASLFDNRVSSLLRSQINLCVHRLRIETGRYERIRNSQGNLGMLDRGERICLHCTLNEVEDESHMLFKCPIYETERATLLIYIQDNCTNFEHLS